MIEAVMIIYGLLFVGCVAMGCWCEHKRAKERMKRNAYWPPIHLGTIWND